MSSLYTDSTALGGSACLRCIVSRIDGGPDDCEVLRGLQETANYVGIPFVAVLVGLDCTVWSSSTLGDSSHRRSSHPTRLFLSRPAPELSLCMQNLAVMGSLSQPQPSAKFTIQCKHGKL